MIAFRIYILSLFLLTYSVLFAQSLVVSEDTPIISITGTSTLHDWTVEANEVADFPESLSIDEGQNIVIDDFSFSVVVASLDGGRGASMNKKINTALLSETEPNIIFDQTESLTIDADSTNFISKGTLEIAGVSKDVEIACSAQKVDDKIVFKGSKDLKMTDFNISPPTAMFGQIKTNDDITVHFEFEYHIK